MSAATALPIPTPRTDAPTVAIDALEDLIYWAIEQAGLDPRLARVQELLTQVDYALLAASQAGVR